MEVEVEEDDKQFDEKLEVEVEVGWEWSCLAALGLWVDIAALENLE